MYLSDGRKLTYENSDFTQKRAAQFDLKGWVKNTSCGRVRTSPPYSPLTNEPHQCTVHTTAFTLGVHQTPTNTHSQVEGEAQGPDEAIQNLLKEINNGPRLAHVVKVEKKGIALQEGESQFGVKRTSETAFDATT